MTHSGTRITRRAFLLAVLLFLTTITVPAQGVNTRRIRFPRGRTTTVIEGAVIRGERDRYLLRARAGQTLIVHITSIENNAVFDIHTPGGRHILAAEATDWTGELPRSGDYTIVVGGTRGNAGYTLEVTVR